MKKSIYFIGMFLIVSLVMSVFVYAAGTSEIPSDTANSNTDDSSDNTDVADSANLDPTATPATEKSPIPEDKLEKTKTACDSRSTRLERIKCRIKNKLKENEEIDYEKRVPEACRTLKNPTACIALYKNTKPCFKLSTKEKDKCFKKAIGFIKTKISEETQDKAQKARQYLVTLLYELEERIEKANEAGKISDEKSAEVIDMIIEIKQDILEEKKKSEIIPKLNQLKKKIRELRPKGGAE